jgi:hypothetical protein
MRHVPRVQAIVAPAPSAHDPHVLQLVFLRPRSQRFKELEIVGLRHELAVR